MLGRQMKITDTDLVLYADAFIGAERKRYLLSAAAHDQSLADAVAAMEASRLPFKAVFDHQPLPGVPDALRAKVRNWSTVSGELNRPAERSVGWFSRFARAVCLAVWPASRPAVWLVVTVFVAYWALVTGIRTAPLSQHTDALSDARQRAWVERVVNYQSLYVEQTTNALEVDWIATTQLLENLAESTGLKVKVPDFAWAGYQFKRVQELGFEGEPLVQLVYSKEDHLPLSLYSMPATGELPTGTGAGASVDAGARVERHSTLTAADWTVDNQRFMLLADENAELIHQLHARAEAEFRRP